MCCSQGSIFTNQQCRSVSCKSKSIVNYSSLTNTLKELSYLLRIAASESLSFSLLSCSIKRAYTMPSSAVRGKAWACRGCWRVYTHPTTVTRDHRWSVAGCPGGANAPTDPFEVSVDHQGMVSGLPAGVQALNTPTRSCWALAPATAPSVATSAAVPSSSGAQPQNTQPQVSRQL